MKYFKSVGSHDGAVLLGGRWVRVSELSRIDVTGWSRHQGPPTRAMEAALRSKEFFRAELLIPELVRFPSPTH